ncbi:radical SAM protein, partial [Candidatus Parcubacteria bacterium]|nr:radical SAM protein [Candidatus Parcubacteria bacterium]
MYKMLSAPISVQVEVTEHCNNRCLHCYNFWRTKDTAALRTLTVDQMVHVVEELADAEVFDLTFTGGEPLLYPEAVLAGAAIARERGMWIGLNTNLTRIEPELAKELRAVGFKSVLTSLCGPNAAVHDGITNHKGSFGETVCGITTALEAGLKVSVNMVTTAINQDYAYETGCFVAGLGVNGFSITRATAPGNCPDFAEVYQVSRKTIKEHLGILLRLEAEYGYNVSVCECHPLCLLGDVARFRKLSRRGCHAGVSTAVVGSDGSIRPCSHVSEVYGNILAGSFLEAWRKMGEWRDGSLLPPTCKECQYFSLCTGGCRMEAAARGDIRGMDTHATGPQDVIPPAEGWDAEVVDLNGNWVLNGTARFRAEA